MKRGTLAAVLVLLLLFCPAKIWASEEGESSLALELEEELVGDMELDKVQERKSFQRRLRGNFCAAFSFQALTGRRERFSEFSY